MDGKEWTGRKAGERKEQKGKEKKDKGNRLRNCLGTEKGVINPKDSLGVSWDGPDWRGLQLIPRTFKGN